MVDELAGKRIVILGLARQGMALCRFASQAGAEVIVSDLRPANEIWESLAELSDIPNETILGHHPLSLLNGTDVLAISGGVPADIPIVRSARANGIPVTNDSLEFMKRAPCTVIGITGSAGKTTTTALTGAMVKTSGRKTWIGGNIGRPLISRLSDMKLEDLVVQELSSFQLEQWNISPPVAAVLNITPNHLDRHKTMAAYRAAKINIIAHQQTDSVAMLSADDPGALSLSDQIHGRLRMFSSKQSVSDGAFIRDGRILLRDSYQEKPVCETNLIALRGSHNILNVLAACTLADSVGIPVDSMCDAIRTFKGVEHRLEIVRNINGVLYVNDSIATAPERALAAIASFSEPIILLAGGRDKDMLWKTWATQVQKKVKAVILFGELADRLEQCLTQSDHPGITKPEINRVETLDQAVLAARELADTGDVVLLSPGGTSFDEYIDFAQRGQAFRYLVNQL